MKITRRQLKKIIIENILKEQDAQEIEMSGTSVTGIRPPESIHVSGDSSIPRGDWGSQGGYGSFDLDVSFVGDDQFDSFVHVGKISELAAIVARHNPDISRNNYVADSLKSKIAERQEALSRYGKTPFGCLVDVGCNGYYLVGVSGGQDQDGNDIPIIIYLDQPLPDRFRSAGLGRGPGLENPESSRNARWAIAPGDYSNIPGVERVLGVNAEGFGAGSNFFVIDKSLVKNYPFDPGSRPGCEATRNFGREIFVSQEENSQEATPVLTPPEEDSADTSPNTRIIKTKMKRWCDQFPQHPTCRYQ